VLQEKKPSLSDVSCESKLLFKQNLSFHHSDSLVSVQKLKY